MWIEMAWKSRKDGWVVPTTILRSKIRVVFVEDGHRIGKGAGPDLNEKIMFGSWRSWWWWDHQDNEDHDDAQPVAHEVEMKGKLMGQLHSHGHLIGKYHHWIETRYQQSGGNGHIFKFLDQTLQPKCVQVFTHPPPLLTPIEAVVSPLAGVQRSDPVCTLHLYKYL